jgi:hypothetical protein
MCRERTHGHAQLVGMLATRPSEHWNKQSLLAGVSRTSAGQCT